ncbi:hypothetical protein JQ631_30890 [Bradyrhizobium manausense]|uniref:beta strand repeat-containing protein n=1 Tax=Bradyrhizobium manausense TaxID=989370 RepID=UPI001BA88718|nr:hypothetical protein [Bradyrhizobium manausense]MBR0793507.1 hypothetical protein [Bradyrhizobium manausense]
MATFKYDPATGAYILVDDSLMAPMAGPAVTTDQADYAPDSVATFTASNVSVGGTVEFIVTHDNPGEDGVVGTADDTFTNDLSGTTSWLVTDGGPGDLDGVANGVVVTNWNVNWDASNQSFLVSAVDVTTGVASTSSFTDAVHFTPVPAVAPNGTNGMIFDTAGAISTGTGIFPSFVQLSSPANGTVESGYNPANPPVDDTGHTAVFNHPIQVKDLDIETVGGQQYYVFRLDANDPNDSKTAAGTVVLEQLKLFYDGTGAALPDGNGLPTGANLLYDMDGNGDISITLTDWSSGSGHGDYVVSIPVSANLSPDTYIYLYSTFSSATGGFEEWALGPNAPPPPPPPTPHAALSFEKATVCPEDGDDVSGGTLLAGNAISWTYTVQNVGSDGTYVSNLTLTDDQLGTLYANGATAANVTLDGDTNNDGLLEKGEIWVFTATGTTVDTTNLTNGIYTNLGTITGDGFSGSSTGTHTETDPDLSGFDTSSYVGVTVASDSVQIIKYVSVDGKADDDPTKTWYDANTAATAPVLLGSANVNPEYKFTITNNSDAQLTVHLTDTKLGVSQDVTLDGNGGTTDVFASGTWAQDLQTNTANVSASFTDDCGNSANPTDSDVANYFGANPSLTISKDIICPDDGDVLKADTSINLLKDADGKVEYRITVTNTGNVAFVNPVVTDSKLTLGAHTDTETGTGTAGDNTLDVGETWTYTVLAAWAAGGPNTNTADVSVSYTDSAGNSFTDDPKDSAIYFGLNPHISLNKLTNGSDGPTLLAGQAITWTYDVTNDGNVDLTGVSVTDNPAQTITGVMGAGIWSAYNSGDLNHDGILNAATATTAAETWHYQATGVAGSTVYTNLATATTNAVSDDCGDSVTPMATDGSSYIGLARATEGLTKGYWGTHATVWDAIFGDEKGAGSEVNVTPKYDWDHDGKTGTNDLSAVVTSGPSSNLGLANGNYNGGGDSGLLMGDLNHDGLVTGDGSTCHLFLDLASAQALANSSVVGDARIILAGQAVAAQLNEYADYVAYGKDTSPNGLINEAVRWLSGDTSFALSANGKSNIDTNVSNDLASPAVKEVISVKTSGSDYTLSGGAITLGGTALSSSDPSWQTKGLVFSETAAGIDFNGDGDMKDSVWANGEGLKNALAAYNHGLAGGTQGFVTSQDGSTIGWENSIGGTPYDVHANTPDAFWGILADQKITGVEWHLA